MPLVAGIDEAGYGPTLGPLVIGATLWQVPPERVRADFWELLKDCVCRSAKRGEWRLRVDDSKRAYDRKKGLHTLERTVLAFARSADLATDSFAALLDSLCAASPTSAAIPWYRELNEPLPLSGDQAKFDAVSQRLSGCMRGGLRCTGLLAEVVDEQRFNQRVASTRNKAAVLIEHVLRLIARSAAHAGGQDLIVRVDRLGGRSNYVNLLRAAFPERRLTVLEQSDTRSRYRLGAARSDWFIEFAVDADRQHLPVALASMLAKYLREGLMHRFNDFWRALVPELRPTAGYYTDAQRFLAEIEPFVARSGVRPEQFVRAR